MPPAPQGRFLQASSVRLWRLLSNASLILAALLNRPCVPLDPSRQLSAGWLGYASAAHRCLPRVPACSTLRLKPIERRRKSEVACTSAPNLGPAPKRNGRLLLPRSSGFIVQFCELNRTESPCVGSLRRALQGAGDVPAQVFKTPRSFGRAAWHPGPGRLDERSKRPCKALRRKASDFMNFCGCPGRLVRSSGLLRICCEESRLVRSIRRGILGRLVVCVGRLPPRQATFV